MSYSIQRRMRRYLTVREAAYVSLNCISYVWLSKYKLYFFIWFMKINEGLDKKEN